ncbi:MAG TPA: energy transducer TonB [Gemmatimonadales bacterium]|nr:energy transducer TonB [Gemmatimonadales bacterium]
MKAFSSVASITVHVGVVGAVLLGSAKTGRSSPPRPPEVSIVFRPLEHSDESGGVEGLPGPVSIPPVDVRFIQAPTLPNTGATVPAFSTDYSGPVSNAGNGQRGGLDGLLTEAQPEVLSGPLPAYPELLRQAGVQGEVLLEAVVDTTGRVLAPSIVIISASHPGFVAAARQALLATLFRPAMVGGRAVQTRVRIPYAFAIRGGTGRAR